MKINFLTLFPNYFEAFKSESIIGKAIARKLIELNVIDLRNYSTNKHKKVDDKVYGGGQGMLIMIEPIDRALKNIKGKKILLSPQGKTFNQKMARALTKEKEITLIAGRYEGFDERITKLVDQVISIGDYVITGGELAAMVIADAIIRLLPNVINAKSIANDSFSDGLLDYPQYTKPRNYQNMVVPNVLLEGNHAKISKWRKKMQLKKTLKIKPKLLKRMD